MCNELVINTYELSTSLIILLMDDLFKPNLYIDENAIKEELKCYKLRFVSVANRDCLAIEFKKDMMNQFFWGLYRLNNREFGRYVYDIVRQYL